MHFAIKVKKIEPALQVRKSLICPTLRFVSRANGGRVLRTIVHPKIAKISPGAEVFQVPLANVRVEIERRIKMMTPGL